MSDQRCPIHSGPSAPAIAGCMACMHAELTALRAIVARVEDVEGMGEYLREQYKTLLMRGRCIEIARAVRDYVIGEGE